MTESTTQFSSEWQSRFPHLVMLESRRNGGLSKFPFESLNLGLNTKDDEETVHANRKLFFEQLEISVDQVAGGLQVHQDEILQVTEPGYYSGYDAFITNEKGVFLSVGIADCTPILIFDPVHEAVAAIHAGWRGTLAQIVTKTLFKMQEVYQTNAADCYAFIGTCIDTEHFEVGEDVAEHFEPQLIHYFTHSKKPHIDLKKANFLQLVKSGVSESQIEVSPFSTVLNNDQYFSFRKENGQTGRMLAVVGIRK